MFCLIILLNVLSSFAKGDEMAQQKSEHFMRTFEELRTWGARFHEIDITKLPEELLTKTMEMGLLPGEGRTERLEKATAFRHSHHDGWFDSECAPKRSSCAPTETAPPLLVISLDAFGADYARLGIVRTLDRLAKCGATAEFMFPSYPTLTIPNHYTVATGLWPGEHGIVDNMVFNAAVSNRLENSRNLRNAAFFGGEPIWSLAERQGKRTHCMLWVGCEHQLDGRQNPSLFLPYAEYAKTPYSAHVDQIVEWLSLPSDQRPALTFAYFDQPDSIAHFHTHPEQVELELYYLETVLNYLFASLNKKGLLDCVNVVITSDHGMQSLDKPLVFSELVEPLPGMIPSRGVIGRYYFTENQVLEENTNAVLEQLTCKHTDYFHVYDKQSLPKRYQHANKHNVGDVIMDSRLGTIFYKERDWMYKHRTADHGYDYRFPQMNAIFFAHGPNIAQGARVAPFQNVELFNLFTDLMQLPESAPNNGTLGLLDEIVRSIPLHSAKIDLQKPMEPTKKCPMVKLSKWSNVKKEGIFHTKLSDNFCTMRLGRDVILTTNSNPKKAHSTTMHYQVLSAKPKSKMVAFGEAFCAFFARNLDVNCADLSNGEGNDEMMDTSSPLVWQSIAAAQKSTSGFNRLQFQMHKGFAQGPFAFLQAQTEQYVQKYGRLVSISATIFDANMNGITDAQEAEEAEEGDQIEIGSAQNGVPTHFGRILLRCEGNKWAIDGTHCAESGATRILAFVLPNVAKERNCLSQQEYLTINTARVRDVELLTGVQLFADPEHFSHRDQLLWRTNITTHIWD